MYDDAFEWGDLPVDGCIGIDVVNTIGALYLDFPSTRLELRAY